MSDPTTPAAVTAGDVRAFLKAGATTTDADLEAALDVAAALLDAAIGTSAVPAPVYARCQLEVAAEVQRGSATRTGQGGQFDTATPTPAPRADPLAGVRSKLAAYVVPF